MEGGGEGVTTVVRDLPDAQLVVSLLSWRQLRLLTDRARGREPAETSRRRVRLQPCASQTVSEYPAVDKNVYTSTYQVAHCGANEWSSTPYHREFPPQRLKPSPTEGNFEVGNHGVSTPRIFYGCRAGSRYSRGHLPRPQHDRDVEAFVNSLRKYPTTERSPSSELLDRLLKTTHSPRSSSPSPPSRLRSRSPRTGDKPGAKEPSHQSKRGKRGKTIRSLNPDKLRFDVRRLKSRNPGTHSLPNGTVSVSTFDYLNSGPSVSPGAELRAHDRDRTLRDAYRGIYRDARGPLTAYPLCPTLQSRYERHVKQCHPTTSKTSYIDVADLPPCNKCLKKRPCPCDAVASLRREVEKEQEERRQFEDTIFTWLKDIPVYPNEKPHDRFVRDAIVKKLAEDLSAFDDKEFTINGKKVIKEAIDKLPMWYPRDRAERENFKNNITDNLLDKIRGLKDAQRFKKAANDFFDKLQFDKEIDKAQALDDITKELNTIALNRPEDDHVYRDMLKMRAFELLDRLPIKTDGNKYDHLNQLSDELADILVNTSPKPLNAEHKQKLREGISEILDEINSIKNRDQVEENLHNVVADIIAQDMDTDKAKAYLKFVLEGKVPDSEVEEIADKVLELADKSQGFRHIHPDTTHMIKEDIRDILDLSNSHIRNRDKIDFFLQKAVMDIVKQDIDRDKATSRIETILKGKIPSDKVEDIVHHVLALVDQVTLVPANELDKETKKTIKDDIRGILDQSDSQIKNRSMVEKKLHKAVVDIVQKDMDRDKAISHIKTALKGKVAPDKVEDIVYQVLELAEQVKPSEANVIDHETKQMIQENIRDILDLSGSKIKNRNKVEENLQKAVADIVKQDMDTDKAISHIITVLKGKVSEDTIEDIADQVLALTNQVTKIQPKAIDHETKQNIKDNISDILDLSDSTIRNRGKVEENLHKTVTDIVTKGIGKDKAIKQIKTVLKGKISDDKVDDIVKQLLALADQVTPSQPIRLDSETEKIIKEDINDILDLSNSIIKNRSKVEQNLHNTLTDIVTKGMDKAKAKTHVKSILKGKVSDDEIEDMCNKLLALADKVGASRNVQNQTFQENIKQDISDILNQSSGRIKNRSKVAESLRDTVNDLLMRGMDRDEAQEHIYSILKGNGNVSDSEALDISKKILILAEQMAPSFREFSSGPSASSTQNADKMYFNQVLEVIKDWLRKRVIGLNEMKLNEVAEAIANETVDREKYLQLNSGITTSQAKELEILKEQIYKALSKFIDKKSLQSSMPHVDELMSLLKDIPVPQLSNQSSKGLAQNSIEFIQENLEGALLNWLRGSPIYQDKNLKNKQTQEQMMLKLAASLAPVLSGQKPGAKTDAVLGKEIIKHIEELPLESQYKSKEYIRKLADHMLDFLKSLQLFQNFSDRISIRDSKMTSFMPLTNQLNSIVKDWCDALPLPDTDEVFQIKQDLANQIILKIGELNMNQDIFNDDLLYEEMLQDFIDQQFEVLQIDVDLTEACKNLMDQIKEVKQRVRDNMVGRAYRQQLRDTISRTLPSMSCPTEEDLASFELLKENLADAFINLNYSVDDEAARAKFKRRIMDEVNKFANDYLSRCPAIPVNARRLNQDLYNALNNIPVPGDDSMRPEIETVRMKEVINDWLKLLPLGKQTKAEQLHTDKIVTLMAQKLQELEKEFTPDFNEIAEEEITKYLKKLPLRNKNNLNGMAKKLVERIARTAESRSFISGTSSVLLCSDSCAFRDQFPPPCPNADNLIPPCGISNEDKNLLQRIKERSQICPTAARRWCRDAAVNPPPSDHESQTVVTPNPSKSCQAAVNFEPICSNEPVCSKANKKGREVSTGSQADLSPCVLVKEYYWDSTSDPNTEATGRTCLSSAPVSPQDIYYPRDPGPCGQTRPQIRLRPCRESRTCVGPRKQLASVCPNDYFTRPKPHKCARSHAAHPAERDNLRSRHRRTEPSCSRRRQSCITCNEDPMLFCPKCCIAPCPYPTSFYFK